MLLQKPIIIACGSERVNLIQPLPLHELFQQATVWLYVFFLFSQKFGLLYITQIVSKGGSFASNVKTYFLRQIRKIFQYVVCWNFTQRAERYA